MKEPASGPKGNLTFRLTCWVLGLIAMIQLFAAGIALAIRVENAREVRVEEKIVTRVVTIPTEKSAEPEPTPAVVALPPPVKVETPLPPAQPLNAPPIALPQVERLVKEAREARVAEDMAKAIVKLKEALKQAPQEPNALYELGLVYETMAAYEPNLAEQASDAYQQVFNLGTSGAGALYQLAAEKLSEGIALPQDIRGKLSLGRVRIFKDDAHSGGERVVLTIPVNAAPGSEPKAEDFFVQVKFFDQNSSGEPLPSAPNAESSSKWVTGAIDWLAGQEACRVTYILPQQDSGQEHLFGKRRYYGQVVELIYKNELIDSQAWPRHLTSLAKTESQPGMEPLFLEEEMLFDPANPLLPPLENEINLPGFPSR